MRFNMRGSLLLLSLVGAVALIAAPVASAHTVDVVGGKTKLTLNPKLAKKLAKHEITLKGTRYAVKGGSYSFHTLDDGGGGEIAHKNALELKSEDGKAKLARLDIVMPVAEHHSLFRAEGHGHEMTPHVSAVVAGERLEVAELGTKNYELTTDYPGFSGLELKLNKQGARLLNQSLGSKLFKKGTKLGELSNKSKIEESH